MKLPNFVEILVVILILELLLVFMPIRRSRYILLESLDKSGQAKLQLPVLLFTGLQANLVKAWR